MRNLYHLLLVGLLVGGCSGHGLLSRPREVELTDGPTELRVGIPLKLAIKTARSRKRDQLGVKLYPPMLTGITQEKATATNGEKYSLTVEAFDTSGQRHTLRPYWWTPKWVFFAVTPPPPTSTTFSFVLISTSKDARLDKVIWYDVGVE